MSFKLTHDDKHFFHAEGAKGPFRIAKKGLTKKQHERYQSLCNGGKVQKLAEGGQVQKVKEGVADDATGVGRAVAGFVDSFAQVVPGYDAGVAGLRSLSTGNPYTIERDRIAKARQAASDADRPSVLDAQRGTYGLLPAHLGKPVDPVAALGAGPGEPGYEWKQHEDRKAMEQAMVFAGTGGPKRPVGPPRANFTAPLTAAEEAAAAARGRGATAAATDLRFAETGAQTGARFGGAQTVDPALLEAARAKARDAGFYGKNGKTTVGKIPWQHMTQEEALAFSQAGEHLKQDKNGQYIGFPRGTTTPEQIAAIQEEALRRVRDVGGLGAGWYEKDGKFIRSVAPEDPRAMARGIATYSPQADPGPNLGWAVSNKNQLLVDPLKESLKRKNMPKTEAQVAKFAKVTSDPSAPMGKGITGQKISQFADDLTSAADPSIQPMGRATLDLHAGRALGFGDDFKRGFTSQEYGAQAGQMNRRLADLQASDVPGPGPNGEWRTVKEAQAADWIGSRARGYIRDYFPGKKMADLNPAQQAEVKAFAMRGFADEAPNFAAHTVVEAVPTVEAKGHLKGAPAASLPERQAFTDASLGPAGERHAIAQDLGAWQYPSRAGLGTFEPSPGTVEMNPNRTFPTLGSYGKGKAGGGPNATIHPATDRLAAFMANYEAAMGVQAGVPTHMAKLSGSSKGNAMRLQFKEPLSPEATKELYAAVDKTSRPLTKGGKPVLDAEGKQSVDRASLTDTGDGGFTLSGNWGGIDKRNFNLLMKNASPELQAAMSRAEVAPAGYTTGPKSGYVDYSKEWKRSPEDPGLMSDKAPVTRKFVRSLQSEPTIMENLGENTAIKADATRRRDANDAAPSIMPGVGLPRANIQKLLGIVGEGGLPGLLEHVKRFGYVGLPAAVVSLMQPDQEEPQKHSQGGFVDLKGQNGQSVRAFRGALHPDTVQRFDAGGQVEPLASLPPEASFDPGLPAAGGASFAPAVSVAPPEAPPAPAVAGPGEPLLDPMAAVAAASQPVAGPYGGAGGTPAAGMPRPLFDRNGRTDVPFEEGIRSALGQGAPSTDNSAWSPQEAAARTGKPIAGRGGPVAQPRPAGGQVLQAQPSGPPADLAVRPSAPAAPIPQPPEVPAFGNFGAGALSAEIADAQHQITQNQQDKAAVETKALSDLSGLEEQKASSLQRIQRERQTVLGERNKISDAMFEELKNSKIDPAHFFEGKETYQKVLAGVGMLLSGMGSGLTGQPNLAMDVINRAIDRDIDAQKANIGLKRNLLSYHQQKTDSLMNAMSLTKADMLDTSAALIEARATQMKSDLAGPQRRIEAQQARQQAAALRGQVSLQEIQAASARYELQMQQYKLRMISQMVQQRPEDHPANGADNTQFLRTAARLGYVAEGNIAEEQVQMPTGTIDQRTGAPITVPKTVWRLFGNEKASNDARSVFQAAASITPAIQRAKAILAQSSTGVHWLQDPRAAHQLHTDIANIKIGYEQATRGLSNQPSAGSLDELDKALGNPGGVGDALWGGSLAALETIEQQVHERVLATRMGAHY